MNTEQLAEKLVLWLEERVLAAGCKGIVIGMSGGIDSSVLAVLCHRAFPQNTLGVIMPCFNHEEDKIHAHGNHNPKDAETQETLCKKSQRGAGAVSGIPGSR